MIYIVYFVVLFISNSVKDRDRKKINCFSPDSLSDLAETFHIEYNNILSIRPNTDVMIRMFV